MCVPGCRAQLDHARAARQVRPQSTQRCEGFDRQIGSLDALHAADTQNQQVGVHAHPAARFGLVAGGENVCAHTRRRREHSVSLRAQEFLRVFGFCRGVGHDGVGRLRDPPFGFQPLGRFAVPREVALLNRRHRVERHCGRFVRLRAQGCVG